MIVIIVIALFSLPFGLRAQEVTLSLEDIRIVGMKIWKNECAGTKEGLTYWKDGEDWLSVGIGHCIWFTNNRPSQFVEGFPDLINFFLKNGVVCPSWLLTKEKKVISCPWRTRAEFLSEFESSRARQLREFLYNTVDMQALFMAQRLVKLSKTKALDTYDNTTQKKIVKNLNDLLKSPSGIYAVIDYINFKGIGLSSQEQYNGQGWGLIAVLKKMPVTRPGDVVREFVVAAKKTLDERVKNAPKERNEGRWLLGWYNRVDTYLS